MRIVYGASSKENERSPSLNDCLETGPPLQNLLWDILVRKRFRPVALSGDLNQAFLPVRIRPEHRDLLRFHWIGDKESQAVEVLRLTRALFGLVQSPFLIGGTIRCLLESLRKMYPDEVAEIEKSLYVDDVISGGETIEAVRDLKAKAVEIFAKGKFTLHKWYSNKRELKGGCEASEAGQSYAKEQLGVKPGETKLLGLPWNKVKNTIAIAFPTKSTTLTKKEILRFLAFIYDPLGLASPISLVGKLVYRKVCEQQLPWDSAVSKEIKIAIRWKKLGSSLPDKIEVPRSIAIYEAPVSELHLHAFGDTSGEGTSAAVYAVVLQPSGINQGLVAAMSRLAKKNLTIPWLELVSAHMVANMVDNVKNALSYPVTSVTGWLDSTTAHYWIKGNGSYKQFVTNRTRKINAKDYINWRLVKTNENPTDLGSRGCLPSDLSESWLKGPEWLPFPEQWPDDIVLQPGKESEADVKLVKKLFTAVEVKDEVDGLLEKHTFWKTVSILARMTRFVNNCKAALAKTKPQSGPLTTTEAEVKVEFLIPKFTERQIGTEQFKKDQLQLNLQQNENCLFECRGRVQGMYPIYIPPNTVVNEKMVKDAHDITLHGGVGMTMTLLRQRYWIPRLRQLTKKVMTKCYGYKKFQMTAYHHPAVGPLPKERTVSSVPFEVVGVDYAGPIAYKSSKKKSGKAMLRCIVISTEP